MFTMRVSRCLVLLGGASTAFGRVGGFVSHPLLVKPRPGCASMKASTPRQGQSPNYSQHPWLADLMASWFKLPPPTSARKNVAKTAIGLSDAEDRAIIQKLRESNAALRAEVLAIRAYMRERGFVPVEDIFADPAAAVPSPAGSPQPAKVPPTQATPKPPSEAALPREARLAALAVLWVAAVSAGGVFIPIAIGEGASQAWRWLDDGGSLVPKVLRGRFGRGGMWGRRGRRWSDAVLSYVPVLRRASEVDEDQERLSGDALAGAWGELTPRRKR